MISRCERNAFIPISGPHPTMVITAQVPESEKVAAITLAWTTPLSVNPPLFGIAITPRKASHKVVERAGVFTVNVLPPDTVDKLWWIGTHSGRRFQDKIAEAGLTSVPGRTLEGAVSIKEAIATFECKVVQEIKVGDHTMFVGEVVDVHAEEEVFDTKQGQWIPDAMNLVLHVARDVFVTNNKENLDVNR